jgi:single-strand DNA-binding protein
MTSHNLVILKGIVAKPPQRHYRPDGSPVVQFPLELNDPESQSPRVGKNLVQIVAFGKLADIDPDLLQSGQALVVRGQLKQRRWETPEGRHRFRVEIIATDLQRLEDSDTNKDANDLCRAEPLTHKIGNPLLPPPRKGGLGGFE